MIAHRPGSLGRVKPKRYPAGRRCACGTILSTYTKEAWCLPCQQNPDRKNHYTKAPKGITMEPETLKAKHAAERLGVSARGLKNLERDGAITPYKTGRGLFGSTFLADDVERLKATRDADLGVTADGFAAGGIVLSVDEDGAPDAPEDVPRQCCGQRPAGDKDCTRCPERDAPCDQDPESCRNGVGCGSPGTCSYDAPEDDPECAPEDTPDEAFGLDPEIEAMYKLREGLEPLDRDAQIRVVKWATARFGIDRPLPASDAT